MIKAMGQITIRDENNIETGKVEPPKPWVIDMLWLDTSGARSILRRWDGIGWVKVNDYDDEIGGIEDELNKKPDKDMIYTRVETDAKFSVTDAAISSKVSETVYTGNKTAVEAAIKKAEQDSKDYADKQDDATKDYVASRGENLVTNGTGLLKNNVNFSQFVFEGVDSYNASGSFTSSVVGTHGNDEFIPVNPDLSYRFSYYMKGNPHVESRAYGLVRCFDADNQEITASDTMYLPNTLTSLAQDLKVGDTVVHLVDVSNWENKALLNTHKRSFAFWNYSNSFGYTYPAETYTRNRASNAWDDGAIDYSKNTITLRVPWTGREYSKGTELSNGSSGSTFKYIAGSNIETPKEWTNYSGVISGVDYSGDNLINSFHPGTASVKIGWLLNRNATGGKTWLSNISFNIDYGGDIEKSKQEAMEAITAAQEAAEAVAVATANQARIDAEAHADGRVTAEETRAIEAARLATIAAQDAADEAERKAKEASNKYADAQIAKAPLFTWIRYSQYADGRSMTPSPTGAIYRGVAFNQKTITPSTNPLDYDWLKIQGEKGDTGDKGTAGVKGADGKTPYVHIRYSNNGGTTFTADGGKTVGDWMGTLTNFTEISSTVPSEYTWAKIKGEVGQRGLIGSTGISITKVDVMYQLGASSTVAPTGTWSTTAPTWIDGQYMWSKTVTTYSSGVPTESKPVMITGGKGATGNTGATGATGRGVTGITEQYAMIDSKTIPPIESDWKNNAPVWQTGKYMWTRSIITYTTSPTRVVTTPVVDTAWEAVNDLEWGGRNLLLGSYLNLESTAYNIATLDLADDIPDGTTVTMTIKGQLGVGKQYWGIYNSGGSVDPAGIYESDKGSDGIYTKTFDWRIAPENNRVHIYTMPSSVVVDSYIEWVKLEIGNRSSRVWYPATEDIQDEIRESSRLVTENFTSFNEQLPELIKDTVSKDFTSKDDFGELKRNTETSLTQTADEFDFAFKQVSSSIGDVSDMATEKFEEMSKYIRFVGGNIILGEEGGETKLTLKITKDKIQFLDNELEVAHFTNKKLYVQDGEFLKTLRLGDFAFQPRTNGNISFGKVR